ncbi:hypothetical protein BDV95DRAFT_149267 [Massariosphaeria phaeospora]|uniref:Uncharacterized protein n=1 Tax=Massariosphaeria phaeospora TaxID=100035 RepID=A0A7C8MFX4_9PLEO|nr:hypothetical protein BDV95DRAFT_149267 [Massariosphaeria phaeospora]
MAPHWLSAPATLPQRVSRRGHWKLQDAALQPGWPRPRSGRRCSQLSRALEPPCHSVSLCIAWLTLRPGDTVRSPGSVPRGGGHWCSRLPAQRSSSPSPTQVEIAHVRYGGRWPMAPRVHPAGFIIWKFHRSPGGKCGGRAVALRALIWGLRELKQKHLSFLRRP